MSISQLLGPDSPARRWARKSIVPSPGRAQRFPWGIYAALSIATWAIQYPGLLSHDALVQLLQASHPAWLSDWHSPAVTLLWGLGTPIFGQPAGALMIQSLLVMLYPSVVIQKSVGLIKRRGIVALGSAVYAVFTLSWISMAGWIIKDSVLLGVFSAALALASVYPGRSSWRVISLGAVLLIGGLLVRPTNFVMIGVIAIVLAVYYATTIRDKRKWVFVSIAITCVSAFVYPITSQYILRAGNSHASDQLILFDVVGMSAVAHEDLFNVLPDWPTNQTERPWVCYTPERADPLMKWGRCKQYAFSIETIRGKYGDSLIYSWWFDAVWQHPAAYIIHRIRYCLALLNNDVYFAYVNPSSDNITKDTLVSTAYGIDVSRDVKIWHNSPIKTGFNGLAAWVFSHRFMPTLSLLACICALIWAWCIRPRSASGPVLVALLASALGLSNFLMLCVFGVADDDRYQMVTFCGGFVALFELSLRQLEQLPNALNRGGVSNPSGAEATPGPV